MYNNTMVVPNTDSRGNMAVGNTVCSGLGRSSLSSSPCCGSTCGICKGGFYICHCRGSLFRCTFFVFHLLSCRQFWHSGIGWIGQSCLLGQVSIRHILLGSPLREDLF